MINPVLGTHREDAGFGADEVRGAPVLDHYTLGAPGGSRSVDDITKVAGANANRVMRQARGALGVDPGEVGIHANDGAAIRRVTFGQVSGGQERFSAGVLEDVGDAIRRDFGVQRHIGRSGLEDAKDCRVEVG